MAMIDAVSGIGRLGQRAGVKRKSAARRWVVACGRPRESREWALLLLAGLFACLVVVLVGLFGLPAGGSPLPSRNVVVRVAAGDTLWSLAHRFAPHDDPRAIVQRIVELNSLGGAKLQAGQPLVVPVDAE